MPMLPADELLVWLPEEPLYTYADPARLAQVFDNLLNNGCKCMKPGGKIWVTAEREGAEVVVTVKDTGIGIPPDKNSIFDMFMQVDRSLERSQSGLDRLDARQAIGGDAWRIDRGT